jgi:dTDP-6-deoxy-L-talose 4-dehydrogenase (NAD+)
MRILVTGATGFIGNYVVNELLKHKFEVIASSANKEKAGRAEWFSKVTYIPFDLASFEPGINYYKIFGEPTLMIHLAWEGLPNYKSSFHQEINLPRHLALLTNLIDNGLSDLTVTGTCFEYGKQEGCLKEDNPALPGNPYGIAKDTLRKEIELLTKNHSIAFKWIRLFYMYGKGQNPNSLLSQLDRALASHEQVFNMSGGEQERDFLPIEKVAAYIIKIAVQNKVTGVINCCSGKPITVREFVENYLRETGSHISLNLGYYPYADYEPMRFWGDTHKLNEIIN